MDSDWEKVTDGKTERHGWPEATYRLRVEGGYLYRYMVEGPATIVSLVFVPLKA
jgi:hypothetical protein